MNKIEQAQEIIENGWCRGDLGRDDTYCSVGAMAKALGFGNFSTADHRAQAYAAVNASREAGALVEEILETKWFSEVDASWQEYLSDETTRPTDVIVEFNDDQESVYPVLEVMKHAAKRLDSLV